MVFLPEVTATLLHYSAMDTCTDCSVVSTGFRGNSFSAFSSCSTLTSQWYGYMDILQFV